MTTFCFQYRSPLNFSLVDSLFFPAYHTSISIFLICRPSKFAALGPGPGVPCVNTGLVPSQTRVSKRPQTQAVRVLYLVSLSAFYFCNQILYVFIWHSQVVFVVFRTVISVKFKKLKCVNLSLPNNHFLSHISLLFLFFLFLPNTPHSSSIITAAATCFDELILDTEMYG